MATKKKTARPMPPEVYLVEAARAKAAIQEIEKLSRNLGFSPKAVKTSLRPLMGHASTPKKLVHEVAAAVDQHAMLRQLGFESERARQELAFAATFEPVATHVEAFAQRIRDAILTSKASAGGSALTVYAAMKGIVRSSNGAALRDSFAKMQVIMKERRKPGAKRLAKAARAAAKGST